MSGDSNGLFIVALLASLEAAPTHESELICFAL